ncbi:Pentatricopeptide repeat-containing protein [Tolypocladium ophioglossoides CBS 100239]|uniref:Pentatricopeptide repeat-containing protein n=1 Tax=Tolypocladium ophioglossoides (strain CBS 100239) TaxID=1163406 RepID=A0A0L0N406_TOLOC|nr:Pentatricopeptide repeat-containing protein [Tolypocladium ophioglossoides CBS 100239]
MLERTAASLETCNLQRLLSKPGRSSKRCRQLHTGFWQHGASAIELSSLWPLPARAADAEADPSSRPTHTGLVASTFLLDFLYPNGTYALLRRLYPSLPRPQDGSRSNDGARKRNFTSSTIVTEPDFQNPIVRLDVAETREKRRGGRPVRQDRALRRDMNTHSPTGLYTDAERHSSAPAASSDAGDSARLNRTANSRTLQDLLSRPDEGQHYDVWDLYCRLDDAQRQTLRRVVIIYLSRSQSIVEIGRALSLLRRIPIDSWDDELQAAGVLVLMRSGDMPSAVDRFKTGLEEKGLSGGLEYLLAESIINRQWPTLLGVWLEYFAALSKRNPDARIEDAQLPQLETISDLGQLYFSFERYVEAEGSGPVRAINLHSDSRLGLERLRRKLAEAALQQPCPPKEAAAILEIWGDCQLYHDYLLRMLDRWNKGLESKSSLMVLPEVYKKYRALSDAKPSVSLLRGMFDLYFPTNAAGLEEIYRDWHTAWGDLDQWGFKKFLKFYAGAGDVQAVKDLWSRYVAHFPQVLKLPRAFRSTMNVYAQTGNVAQAEQELRTMTAQYGVKPDIDIWNTLLKCYTRAEDLPRVLQCFEEIRAIHRPDSFTYAHVMAMAAKKGDLETTLDFFNQSQKDQVPVSKEMAMALVTAYCRNDRLVEAEKICTELAERKSTSAAIWNKLLYFNGVQGKLNKCYELLQAMKTFNVEWDHQTHEFLLQALVRVDQIQAAYHLLQSAYEDKLFPVGPEHFAVVMAGAVRTGELALVETILSHMRRAEQPMTFNAQVALVEAAFRQTPSAKRTRRLGREFVKHLRCMLPKPVDGGPKQRDNGTPVSNAPGSLMELRKQTQGIGRAIMLLVELRDFATAEELVNMYAEIFPEYKGEASFPPEVASALMLGYLKDGRLAQVHKMWGQTWKSVLSRSQRPQGGGIYPAHQYDLSRPIGIVAKAFREGDNGRGLLSCVEQVTGAGFKLTRSNWNLVVKYLAEMGHWERAMDWCETMLMPRWRGWKPGAKSLQEGRDMKNTRVLQASKAAVFSLQKEWLKLRKLAAWSAQVSHKLKEIEQKHPMLHYAFITTDYEHLPATWVLPKKKSLTRAIKEMLKPLSHAELRVMKRTLERQLALARDKKPPLRRTAVRSPFHVVTGRSKEEVYTKAFEHGELKQLDAALRDRLSEMEAKPAVDEGEELAEREPLAHKLESREDLR